MVSEWRRIAELWKETQERLWWKHQKPRLLATARQDVSKLRPIGKGTCMTCGKEDDFVFPISIEVCVRCARKGKIKGSFDKAIRRVDPDGMTICTLCSNPVSYYFKVSGKVCNKCTKRFGKRVNRGKEELKRK